MANMTPMSGWIRGPRWVALRLVALLVLAAAVASFAQSYRGLYLWAVHHGEHGFWAACWPLMVDSFIAVGEIALFVALVDGWDRRRRSVAWTVTAIGLAISVAGNIGHAPTNDLATRITFGVPPLAAAGALFVGLVILKAVISGQPGAVPVATVTARDVAMARSGDRGYAAAMAASDRAREAARRQQERAASDRPPRSRKAVTRRPAKRSPYDDREAAIAALVTAPEMSVTDLAARLGVDVTALPPHRTVRRWRVTARQMATAAANGHEDAASPRD